MALSQFRDCFSYRLSGVRHGPWGADTLLAVTIELTARVMGGEVDDGDEVVEAGLAEHADGSGWALFFQRTDYEPDEQDIRWGMDSYCLTTGGGLTVYGGLRRAELDGDVLRLILSSGAAEVLRLAEVVTVRLEVEAGMRQVLGPEGARGLGEGRHHLTRHASGS